MPMAYPKKEIFDENFDGNSLRYAKMIKTLLVQNQIDQHISIIISIKQQGMNEQSKKQYRAGGYIMYSHIKKRSLDSIEW